MSILLDELKPHILTIGEIPIEDIAIRINVAELFCNDFIFLHQFVYIWRL